MPKPRRPHLCWLPLLSLLLAGPSLAVDLKIATLAPDGTQWMQEMRKGAEEISRRTQERVQFKFYPGGSMGSDRSVLRKIRAGQLHGGALTGGALSEFYPDSQLYNLPFLFRSTEELDYVRARMDKTLARGIEERGFVTYGFSDGGFAYLMSNSPLRSTEDLKGQKIWVPEGDETTRALFESLGVSPIPLPLTDVLTGLQTGLITTIGSSSIGAIALQWHTRIKYVTDTPAMYLYGTLALDKKAIARLSEADQKIVREVMERIFSALNQQNRIDDRNAYEALRRQGISFVSLEPDELVKLRNAADQTIERFAKQGAYSATLLATLRGHLADYRRRPDSARKH